jgi:uncharacterized glyoxalase superfamily protein PhnB
MKLDIKAKVHPDITIGSDDVDAVYDRATAAGARDRLSLHARGLGVRRFFVRDPNGTVINVTQHD